MAALNRLKGSAPAMFKSEEFVERQKAEVDLTLMDGTALRGNLFITQRQRLVDVMNDPRAYIPIELEDGSIKLVNKSNIGTVALIQ